MSTAVTFATVTKIGGRIGAEIGGVRLGGDLPAATVAEIRAALLAHKVVFFRGQDHLDETGHEALAQLLGAPVAHPHRPLGRRPLRPRHRLPPRRPCQPVARRRHLRPRLPGLLRPPGRHHPPPYGGNTLWANTATAYSTLPVPLRALADSLRAVHSNEYDYAALRPDRFTLVAAELARREGLTLRELIARLGAGRGHRVFAGAPEQIADQLEEWFTRGAADGFNIMAPVLPSGLTDFVDHVVPVLQRRGLFRTEYGGRTLRENYGLPRPANRYARTRPATS